MNRKILTALASTVLLGVAGFSAYAAGGPNASDDGPRFARGPGPGFAGELLPPDLMMGPGMLKRVADKLELTQEQRETIKGFFESARPGMRSLRQEMRANAELLRSTKPDAPNYSTVVSQASQKAGELASRMVTDASQLRTQIWQVLTPEQRIKLDELQTTFRERAREHRRNHRPPAPEGQPNTN